MKEHIIKILEQFGDLQLNLNSIAARELIATKINNKLYKIHEDLYDECVMCDTLTNYKTTDHINYREFYIEGAGQLCESCYNKIY